MIRINFLVTILAWGILVCPVSVRAVDDREDAISMHGFISQGFLLSDTNDVYADTRNGSFQFNEFGFTVMAQLSDRLHAGIQVLSRDLGDYGNNDVNLDWAFADYRWKDSLGFRGGVLKIPWGVYNETRDIDMLRTSIFLPSSLYPEELRDVYDTLEGIALYGSFGLWKLGTLNYQLQYGDKSLPIEYISVSGEPGELMTVQAFDVQDIYMATLEWETPLEGLRLRETTGEYGWHVRGTGTLSSEFGERQRAWSITEKQVCAITSADYSTERVSLALEWQQVWNDEGEEIELEDNAEEGGWYVGASYRFTDWLEIGSYYSVYYDDSDDKDGTQLRAEGLPAYLAWQKDLALTTRFDFGEHWTVKFEGHLIDGAAQLIKIASELPERHTVLLAAKMTFNF